MLHAFPGEVGEREWRRMLSRYTSPSSLGAIGLLIAWLNAGRPLGEACRLACADPEGPRFSPEELMDALAATWMAIPRSAREPMDVFRKPAGASHTVATMFGSFLLDSSAIGRRLRIHIEPAVLATELSAAFGAAGDMLAKRLREKSEKKEPALLMSTEGLKSFLDHAHGQAKDDTELLATLRSPEAMTEGQRLGVHAMAYAVARALSGLRDQDPKVTAHLTDAQKAKWLLARLLSQRGPTLTEDAWDAILAEQDAEALAWMAALSSLRADEIHAWQIRRALLENAALRQYAMKIGRDAKAMNEVSTWIEEARAVGAKGK
jgi:hypothetical protein